MVAHFLFVLSAFVCLCPVGSVSFIFTLSLKSLLAAGTTSLNLKQFSERQSVVFRLQVLLWSNRLLGVPALVFVLLLAFVNSRMRVQSASYLLPLLHIILSCIMITRLWSLNWKTKAPAAQSAAAVADRAHNLAGVVPSAVAPPAGSRVLASSRPERASAVASALDRMHGLTSFRFPQGLGLDRPAVAPVASGGVAGPPLLGSTAQLGSFNTHNRRVMTGSATRHAQKPSISTSSLSQHQHDIEH